MKNIYVNLIFWITLLFICAVVIAIGVNLSERSHIDTDLGIPHEVMVVDDHEVALINDRDTIFLYMEDAWSVADEWLIYVKQ